MPIKLTDAQLANVREQSRYAMNCHVIEMLLGHIDVVTSERADAVLNSQYLRLRADTLFRLADKQQVDLCELRETLDRVTKRSAQLSEVCKKQHRDLVEATTLGAGRLVSGTIEDLRAETIRRARAETDAKHWKHTAERMRGLAQDIITRFDKTNNL